MNIEAKALPLYTVSSRAIPFPLRAGSGLSTYYGISLLIDAINYLNNPDVYKLGDKVIVIGAGNAAMDVARTAMRHGAREGPASPCARP